MSSKRERDRRTIRKTNAQDWGKNQERGEATSIKLPQGIDFWKLTPGKYVVDFMPYIVGKGNPRADEGFQHFEREFTDHRVPKPDGKNSPYLCLWANFKKACPICKLINTNNTDPELKKSLKSTVRHLWLINDKPGNEDNPLKVFVSNHYNKKMGFGEMMASLLSDSDDYKDFTDLENGLSVKLVVEELSGGGFKYNAVTRIDFLPRKYTYSDSMLDKAPCLDDMLIEYSAADLEKLLNVGSTTDEETPDDDVYAPAKSKVKEEIIDDEDLPKTTKKAPTKVVEPEDDEQTAEELGIEKGSVVEHEEHGLCEVVHVSGDGSSLKIKDGKGKIHSAVNPNDCELIEEHEDEEEIAPPKKPTKKPVVEEDELDDDEPTPPKKPIKKPAPVDPDDDDDLDFPDELDDDDDEPTPPKKPSRK